MIGVDKIGAIRRAYFEEHRPIKEIVRTPSVSRGKVRKVIRSHETELKYEQGGFHIPPQAPRFSRQVRVSHQRGGVSYAEMIMGATAPKART